MTAPAACAACNHHESSLSTALDASAAAIQAPGFRKPMISLDDTFSKAQTDRRTTQLLAPGETSSPSQLNQPSRHGCGAVPSRWASRVVPGASGGAEGARGTARGSFTKICPLHTRPLPPLAQLPVARPRLRLREDLFVEGPPGALAPRRAGRPPVADLHLGARSTLAA